MTAAGPFEIGLFTFGEITDDPVTGRPIDPAVRLDEFIHSPSSPTRPDSMCSVSANTTVQTSPSPRPP